MANFEIHISVGLGLERHSLAWEVNKGKTMNFHAFPLIMTQMKCDSERNILFQNLFVSINNHKGGFPAGKINEASLNDQVCRKLEEVVTIRYR